MKQLLLVREYINNFISRNETYAKPVGKFILAMITFIMINSKMGYTARLNNFAIVVIMALVSSFLPLNFIAVMAAGLILVHLYSLSLESVMVVGIVLVLMFLLYFRFSPKDTLLLIFTPIASVLNIPYAVALSAGLVSSVASLVSVACGTIIYSILRFINENVEAIKAMSEDSMMERLKFYLDGIIRNKEMVVLVAAFSITIIAVNIVRRMSVDHAWTIAIVIGSLLDIVIVLAGDLKFDTYISVGGLIFGSLVALLTVVVIKFFVFNVDYGKTEKVQFEDDDYYYYVKAVPKNKVSIGRSHRRIHEPEKDVDLERVAEHRRSRQRAEEVPVRKSSPEKKTSQSGNKNSSKRIIEADEELRNGRIVKKSSGGNYRTDSNGMTGIERAAAAKARASRNNQ